MSGLDRARSTARFTSDHPVPALFSAGAGNWQVSLCDLSVTGAQIEHTQVLRPSMQGRLIVGNLQAGAVVIWTRMTVPGRYRSGLRLEEQLDVVAAAIRDLLARGVVRKAEDTQHRRDQARLDRAIARAQERANAARNDLPAATVQTIRAARQWLLENPDEALKWHQRARRIATETQLQIAGSGRLNREDVLAVWEYLERRFGLADIVRVLGETGRQK